VLRIHGLNDTLTCILNTSLLSSSGRDLFASAFRMGGCHNFFILMEQFTTQSEPAYCGISSLVMILNALAVDPRRVWKGPWRWYHEEMLNCCMDLQQVRETGITLPIFVCLAKCQGLYVQSVLAQDCTLQEFRTSVQQACMDRTQPSSTSHPLLVVSYHRGKLQQTGTGHFSPIAAYDPSSDQVLILDTARFKYGAHWVPLNLLFEAMRPIDSDTGRSRGFVLLSFPGNDGEDHSNAHNFMDRTLPISFLLRTSQTQNPIRRKFRHYIQNEYFDCQKQDIDKFSQERLLWNHVWTFWTEKNPPNYIWEIMEPQLIPTVKEEMEAVQSVRNLLSNIQKYIQTNFQQDTTIELDKVSCKACRPNCNRTIPLTVFEAIVLIFLAVLPKDQRIPWVQHAAFKPEEANHVEDAQHQLLIEAELIQCALDTCDDSSF
jgi:glutathione gamma-glutamylcysteinyltransferase